MCRICTKAIESKPPVADDLPLRGLAFECHRWRANCGAVPPRRTLCSVRST